jgi:SpoVK/Ycf46/Vps4 family AAA+-type ATPase
LIIGATNRPDDLDEAVRRRLVKRLYIPLPNKEGRKQYIKQMIEKTEGVNTFKMEDADIDELVDLTKGYSGADLKNLSGEAALIPIRQVEDIANIDVNKIRPLDINDFKEALFNVKATVNSNDLQKFMEWNKLYGSYPINIEEIST